MSQTATAQHDLEVGNLVTMGGGGTTWRVTYATWSCVAVRSAKGRTRHLFLDAPREVDRITRLHKVPSDR